MKSFFHCLSGIAIILTTVACAAAQTPDKDPLDTTGVVFTIVEKEAEFPGGDKAWRIFLERNLNSMVPVNNRAPAGTYTVVIQFVVGKNGDVEDIRALTSHGYGMEAEVIRILRKSPDWEPAILNGKPVRAYRKQPVTFLVMEEEKKKKRKNRD